VTGPDHEQTLHAGANPGTSYAAQRLVQLYEALGKKGEAARWRRELAARKTE
jgi:hypothetical protein